MPSTILTVSEPPTRADSRDTYQSFQLGPALIEETTLTDLEDEISSSLMMAELDETHQKGYYSDGEQLAKRYNQASAAATSHSLARRKPPSGGGGYLYGGSAYNKSASNHYYYYRR